MRKVIIDRFEGKFAVVELEDLSTANIERSILPESAKEGDTIILYIDEQDTEERRERIRSKMDKLINKLKH